MQIIPVLEAVIQATQHGPDVTPRNQFKALDLAGEGFRHFRNLARVGRLRGEITSRQINQRLQDGHLSVVQWIGEVKRRDGSSLPLTQARVKCVIYARCCEPSFRFESVS